MKFKFAPIGAYLPGQSIVVAGVLYAVVSVAPTGRSLTVRDYKGKELLVILTDEPPIKEKT